MALSQLTGQYSFGTIAYDTWENRWAWSVMITCKKHSVYPEEILALLEDCLRELREAVTIENDPYIHGSIGSLQALNCSIVKPNEMMAQQGAERDAASRRPLV